jgi:hypothetical protein
MLKKHFGDFACLNPVDRVMTESEWRAFKVGETSFYYGVFYNTKRKAWYSSVSVDKKRVMKEFATENEAALAYNFYVIYYNLDLKLNNIHI